MEFRYIPDIHINKKTINSPRSSQLWIRHKITKTDGTVVCACVKSNNFQSLSTCMCVQHGLLPSHKKHNVDKQENNAFHTIEWIKNSNNFFFQKYKSLFNVYFSSRFRGIGSPRVAEIPHPSHTPTYTHA